LSGNPLSVDGWDGSGTDLGAGLAIRLHEFGEHAADTLRMDKADLRAMGSGPGGAIQELRAADRRALKRCPHILGGVGDVMHGLAALLEEFLHLRVRVQRRDQLDAALPNRDHRNLDAFGFEPLAAAHLQAKAPLIHLDRRIEITDRDPDVIDPAQHALILCPAAARSAWARI